MFSTVKVKKRKIISVDRRFAIHSQRKTALSKKCGTNLFCPHPIICWLILQTSFVNDKNLRHSLHVCVKTSHLRLVH